MVEVNTTYEMNSIYKDFDAVSALKGASLSVRSGEIMALLGSNGSGKSTMIKVLAGLVKPDSGSIKFGDEPVSIADGYSSRRHGIATAFQDLSLIPTMSVMDNIMLGRETRKKSGIVNKKASREETECILERFGITCDPDAYVETLPPSMRSMLEVAKAVALKPKLLLLDEVTASLHQDEIQVLFRVLNELKAEGAAIVYVTHRMNEIFQICTQATIMRSGETVICDDIDALKLDDIIYCMTGQYPDLAAHEAQAQQRPAYERKLLLGVRGVSLPPKVHDISLEVYKGEIVGIGGLGGQGQSEFIRTLLGVEKAEKGEIIYDGREVAFKSPAEAVKSDIGFISGERSSEAIFPDRTVRENIFAGNAAKGGLFKYLPAREVNKFARAAVEEYAIVAGSLAHTANSLSGGNQQKLVVARWIATMPKLLLLDDPTKGVDVHSRREIHNILRACAANGMAVIISSSENEELIEIADRIYVFYEGGISGILSGTDKTPERFVATMMGMKAEQSKGGEA